MRSKNYPIIASRTFEKFKSDPSFLKIVKSLVKRLGKVRDAFKRARIGHREVDLHLKEVFKNPITKALSCREGCSACCHSQVGITEDEGELLAQKIMDGHPIDLRTLNIQAEVGSDHSKWYELPYELRGCTFLDKNGSCSIYEDRPMVCRTNYVFSDPNACKTIDGVLQPLRLLNTHKADMAIMGAFEAAKSTGALPSMVWKALKKHGRVQDREANFPFSIPRRNP